MAKAFTVLESTSHLSKKDIRTVLQEAVITLGSQEFSAHFIATIAEYPNLRAARQLNAVCKKLHITSLAQLNRVGLYSLLNVTGFGERTAWIASMLLYAGGYDVTAWCDRGRIRAANTAARRRGKHSV